MEGMVYAKRGNECGWLNGTPQFQMSVLRAI